MACQCIYSVSRNYTVTTLFTVMGGFSVVAVYTVDTLAQQFHEGTLGVHWITLAVYTVLYTGSLVYTGSVVYTVNPVYACSVYPVYTGCPVYGTLAVH